MSDLYKKEFIKNAFWSYSANVFSVLAGFLYIFIVANALGPAQYGLLAFLLDFMSNIASLFGFVVLSEILVTFIPKQRNKALLWDLLKIGFLVALFFSAVVFLFPNLILILANQGSTELVRAIAALIFVNSLSNLLISALSGARMFGKILKLTIAENTLNIALSVFFIFVLNAGVLGVVYAKMLSLLGTAMLGFVYCKTIPLRPTPIDWRPIKRFAFFSFLLVVLRRASSQIILFLIVVFVDPAKLGFYYLVLKVSTYFMELPIVSMNTVLLPTISAQENNRQVLCKTVSKNIKFYLLLSVAFSTALLIFGSFFLEIFFPSYYEASSLIPFFAVYFLLTFDISLGSFYRAIKRNDVLVNGSVIMLVASIVPGYYLIQNYGVFGIVVALIVNRALQLAYLSIDISKHGYEIDFVPRAADLRFFLDTAMHTVKNRFR